MTICVHTFKLGVSCGGDAVGRFSYGPGEKLQVFLFRGDYGMHIQSAGVLDCRFFMTTQASVDG